MPNFGLIAFAISPIIEDVGHSSPQAIQVATCAALTKTNAPVFVTWAIVLSNDDD